MVDDHRHFRVALHQWRELKRTANRSGDDELAKLGKDVAFLTDRISRLTALVEQREARDHDDDARRGRGGGGAAGARGASATAVLERRMAVQEKLMRRMARQLEALASAAKKKKK